MSIKTIPVRSSYLRILAIKYQGARKDRLLLNGILDVLPIKASFIKGRCSLHGIQQSGGSRCIAH